MIIHILIGWLIGLPLGAAFFVVALYLVCTMADTLRDDRR